MNETRKGQVKNMSNVYARFMIPAFFLVTFAFGEITEDTKTGRIVASAAEEVTTSFLQSRNAGKSVAELKQITETAGYQVDPSNPMSVQIGEFYKAATPNPLDLVNPIGYLKDVFVGVGDMFDEIGTSIDSSIGYTIDNAGN